MLRRYVLTRLTSERCSQSLAEIVKRSQKHQCFTLDLAKAGFNDNDNISIMYFGRNSLLPQNHSCTSM